MYLKRLLNTNYYLCEYVIIRITALKFVLCYGTTQFNLKPWYKIKGVYNPFWFYTLPFAFLCYYVFVTYVCESLRKQ